MSPAMRRATALVCLALLVGDGTSCYRTAERVPPQVVDPAADRGLSKRLEGFTTADARWHDVHDRPVSVRGDSLYVEGPDSAAAYSLGSVTSVTVRELDGRRTTWVAVGVGVSVLAVVVYIGVRQALSCALCGANLSGLTSRAPRAPLHARP